MCIPEQPYWIFDVVLLLMLTWPAAQVVALKTLALSKEFPVNVYYQVKICNLDAEIN